MAMHRINRVEFELEVSAVELGRQLSDRVSVLNGRRIPSLIDAVCSEVDDSDVVARIDTLELELGTIALGNFDEDLLAKLEAALRTALRGRPRRPIVQSDVPPGTDASAPAKLRQPGDARELLDVYAWTGNFLWWADAREPKLVARHIRDLLVHAQPSFVELLREHAEDPVGLARLARACDDELFDVILERAGAAEALPDLHALTRLLALVSVPAHRMRASLLRALGRFGRLEAPQVLPIVLGDLDEEVFPALAARLEERPEWDIASVRDAIVHASARASGHAARQRPDEHADTPASVQTKIDTTTDAAEHDEIETSAPTTQEQMQSAATPAHDPSPRSPQPNARNQPRLARSAKPDTADEPKLAHARRRALARLDELYIEDAGLVILWPFLERLFTRVELLHERQFPAELAQTQAIALLAWLGLEDPEPPEHRLVLPKLLCGRSPEQPCEFDGPLAAELRDECDLMLAAVIDHAPVLDAMPIPQFRASFLQRAGVLAVRTGSWLLTVDRQPYDLVLDRFSWSWAWVKLPWMPEPVTVEW